MPVAAGAAGSSAGAATSLLTSIGVGAGGIFVAVALILVLIYLNLLNASEQDVRRLQILGFAAAVPLFATFMAIVMFEALAVI